MKRIKPGRGPSMMGAAGSVFTAVFGVIWTILAISMGAPVFFPLFGVVFICAAIVQGIYHYRNATGKERYSVFDIVDDGEEGDPLDRWGAGRSGGNPAGMTAAARATEAATEDEAAEVNFCPYCGAKAEKAFRFCQKCGKQIR